MPSCACLCILMTSYAFSCVLMISMISTLLMVSHALMISYDFYHFLCVHAFLCFPCLSTPFYGFMLVMLFNTFRSHFAKMVPKVFRIHWFYKVFRRFENALRKPSLGNAFWSFRVPFSILAAKVFIPHWFYKVFCTGMPPCAFYW